MKTILVVDDDSRMLKLLNMYLAPVYKVCSAKGGSIAIEFLKNHKPDLIILDYKMPGLDGPATFDIIKVGRGVRSMDTLLTDRQLLI